MVASVAKGATVPLMTPDPTFYPSPAMAAQAQPETLAYLALIHPEGGRDAIGVVDLDPASTRYGRFVGRTDMPHAGDELHHMGLAAWVVYRRLGLGVLRRAWINLDWMWAGALVVTGAVVLWK